MTSRILSQISTTATPQTEQARPDQVRNDAGGYVFAIPVLEQVKRFLILGVDGGTYYAGEREHALRAFTALQQALDDYGPEVVDLIVDVSERGVAPKQDPALFALAYATAKGDDATRHAAFQALPRVARTGTHLFQFLGYRKQFAGVGRGLRTALSQWYLGKTPEALAYQLVKYRQREGWTHRDVLRIAHPHTVDARLNAVLKYAAHGETGPGLPDIIFGFRQANEFHGGSAAAGHWAYLVREFGLTREMLPDEAAIHREVWEAMLEAGMPQTALLRQLPTLTRLGVLKPLGAHTSAVEAQLTNRDRLRKARVHPLQVLIAARTYESGHGMSATWEPVPQITAALERAFYEAFHTIEPAGKRTLVALDVSGSMSQRTSLGSGITAAEIGAALAMAVAASEPVSHIVGFADVIRPLGITSRMSLSQALQITRISNFGGTDAALAVQYASRQRLEVDTFVVITDNETWSGGQHLYQALAAYRRSSGIPARLAVLAVTSTGFTIADLNDPGMLDIAGFSADVPALLTEFSRGF